MVSFDIRCKKYQIGLGILNKRVKNKVTIKAPISKLDCTYLVTALVGCRYPWGTTSSST